MEQLEDVCTTVERMRKLNKTDQLDCNKKGMIECPEKRERVLDAFELLLSELEDPYISCEAHGFRLHVVEEAGEGFGSLDRKPASAD